MKNQTWKAAVSAAAIAAGAAIPMAANAAWSEDTYTTITNGVTWTYVVDEEAGKIMLGKGTSSAGKKMVDASTAGVLYIPTTLAHEGTTYNVTDYAYGGLSSCASLKGVVFPETTFAQIANGAALFQSMGACKAIWWKGPNTVASGTQPVSEVGGGTQLFRYDHSLKAVVLGPNVKYGYVARLSRLFRDELSRNRVVPLKTLAQKYFQGVQKLAGTFFDGGLSGEKTPVWAGFQASFRHVGRSRGRSAGRFLRENAS